MGIRGKYHVSSILYPEFLRIFFCTFSLNESDRNILEQITYVQSEWCLHDLHTQQKLQSLEKKHIHRRYAKIHLSTPQFEKMSDPDFGIFL